MIRREYTERLAQDIEKIMTTTLMDSAYQGNLLKAAAKEFAAEIMRDWMWNEMLSDAEYAMERAVDDHIRYEAMDD